MTHPNDKIAKKLFSEFIKLAAERKSTGGRKSILWALGYGNWIEPYGSYRGAAPGTPSDRDWIRNHAEKLSDSKKDN